METALTYCNDDDYNNTDDKNKGGWYENKELIAFLVSVATHVEKNI